MDSTEGKIDSARSSIDKTVTATAAVLGETQRWVDLIQDPWSVGMRLSVPTNQEGVRAYSDCIWNQYHGAIGFHPGHKGFPSLLIPEEYTLATTLAGIQYLELEFFKPGNLDPALTLDVDYEDVESADPNYFLKTMYYDAGLFGPVQEATRLIMSYHSQRVDETTGTIRSYRDFGGTKLKIYVSDLARIHGKVVFELEEISVRTPDNRQLVIHPRPTECEKKGLNEILLNAMRETWLCFEAELPKGDMFRP